MCITFKHDCSSNQYNGQIFKSAMESKTKLSDTVILACESRYMHVSVSHLSQPKITSVNPSERLIKVMSKFLFCLHVYFSRDKWQPEIFLHALAVASWVNKWCNNLYLPLAVFIVQVLVRLSKQLKQIIQAEHKKVSNPNWPEAHQLAMYKRGQGFERGATEKQIRVVIRAGLEPGTTRLRVRHSATLSPWYYDQIFTPWFCRCITYVEFHERIKTLLTVCKYPH